MSTSGILAAELVAAQHRGPGGAVHLVLLAAIAAIALAVFGVSRWRQRRARGQAEPTSHDVGAKRDSAEKE
jgi:uncharacterized iron-regulated membrane protein